MTNDQTKRFMLKAIEDRHVRGKLALAATFQRMGKMVLDSMAVQPMQDAPGLAPGLVFPLDFVYGPNSRSRRRHR